MVIHESQSYHTSAKQGRLTGYNHTGMFSDFSLEKKVLELLYVRFVIKYVTLN